MTTTGIGATQITLFMVTVVCNRDVNDSVLPDPQGVYRNPDGSVYVREETVADTVDNISLDDFTDMVTGNESDAKPINSIDIDIDHTEANSSLKSSRRDPFREAMDVLISDCIELNKINYRAGFAVVSNPSSHQPPFLSVNVGFPAVLLEVSQEQADIWRLDLDSHVVLSLDFNSSYYMEGRENIPDFKYVRIYQSKSTDYYCRRLDHEIEFDLSFFLKHRFKKQFLISANFPPADLKAKFFSESQLADIEADRKTRERLADIEEIMDVASVDKHVAEAALKHCRYISHEAIDLLVGDPKRKKEFLRKLETDRKVEKEKQDNNRAQQTRSKSPGPRQKSLEVDSLLPSNFLARMASAIEDYIKESGSVCCMCCEPIDHGG